MTDHGCHSIAPPRLCAATEGGFVAPFTWKISRLETTDDRLPAKVQKTTFSRDRQHIRGWYSESESHLPPGLAKKDRLPPGLERQLIRNGTLPPGLQKRLYPAPVELERRLPPPPPDCAHMLIGGHIVLLNHKTNVIVDVFAF